MINPTDFYVDSAYQRNISEKGMRQIRRIIEGFDWASFKPQTAPWTTSAERHLAADRQSHLTGEYLEQILRLMNRL
ncbi:hypothetical protein ELH62_37105 [Rhizobium ruizarguesonis]|nr:hypothetical protein ELH62_37105 [Rhizobium ruizarguesonis]